VQDEPRVQAVLAPSPPLPPSSKLAAVQLGQMSSRLDPVAMVMGRPFPHERALLLSALPSSRLCSPERPHPRARAIVRSWATMSVDLRTRADTARVRRTESPPFVPSGTIDRSRDYPPAWQPLPMTASGRRPASPSASSTSSAASSAASALSRSWSASATAPSASSALRSSLPVVERDRPSHNSLPRHDVHEPPRQHTRSELDTAIAASIRDFAIEPPSPAAANSSSSSSSSTQLPSPTGNLVPRDLQAASAVGDLLRVADDEDFFGGLARSIRTYAVVAQDTEPPQSPAAAASASQSGRFTDVLADIYLRTAREVAHSSRMVNNLGVFDVLNSSERSDVSVSSDAHENTCSCCPDMRVAHVRALCSASWTFGRRDSISSRSRQPARAPRFSTVTDAKWMRFVIKPSIAPSSCPSRCAGAHCPAYASPKSGP
jgi:hypothetical protein